MKSMKGNGSLNREARLVACFAAIGMMIGFTIGFKVSGGTVAGGLGGAFPGFFVGMLLFTIAQGLSSTSHH